MWKTILTSVLAAIVGGLVVFFAMSAGLPGEQAGRLGSSPTTTDSAGRSSRPSGVQTAAEIYERHAAGVVHINAVFMRDRSDFFGFRLPPEAQESSGSGFIIDKSGVILTNAHVVQDSGGVASRVTVVLSDEEEVEAELLGTDPSTDIAVLKIDPGRRDLQILELGDSSQIKVGDTVYAIGSPFGLEGTMTEGIISAMNRTIDSPNAQFRIRNAIQTDAAVNPGNSGGPLINEAGEVIGINSQIATRTGAFAGIAFAVPSNTVEEVAREIRETGKASHPYIGISGVEINKAIADEMKLPVDRGVMVVQVVPGSPAEKAGLQGGNRAVTNPQTGQRIIVGGDIVTSIEGDRVSSMENLLAEIEDHEPGDKVRIEYYRGNDKRTATLTLAERPQTFND